MTTVKIMIKNTNDIKDFIFFLYKSGVHLDIHVDNGFYWILHMAIKEKKVYPLWLKRDNLAQHLSIMKDQYPDLDYENDYLLSNELLQPTPEFSHACGKENLTAEGLISKEMAYDFILRQVTFLDDIIHLREDLQNLLNANSVKIDKYELILLLDNLFQSDSSQHID